MNWKNKLLLIAGIIQLFIFGLVITSSGTRELLEVIGPAFEKNGAYVIGYFTPLFVILAGGLVCIFYSGRTKAQTEEIPG